jgi:hypothetical protein
LDIIDVTVPNGTHILVIDTNAYSGNFERELCGFITGYYDFERGQGEYEADTFRDEEDTPIFDKVTQVPHNEYGMVSNTIRATPGRLNNGMGFHYDAGGDTQEAIIRAKRSMEEYHATSMAGAQKRIDNNDFESEETGRWTREACERTIESARASIDRAGRFVSNPAFESVAIFLSEPLSSDEFEIVKRRALQYAADPKKYTKLGVKPFLIRDIYMLRQDATEVKI